MVPRSIIHMEASGFPSLPRLESLINSYQLLMNDLELDSSRLPANRPLAKMGFVDKIYSMRGSPRLLSAFCSLLAVGLYSSSSSFAQTSRLLIGWDLPINATNITSVASGTNDSAVLANNIQIGSGLTASPHATGWGATGWTFATTNSAYNPDPSVAIPFNMTTNDYIFFRVSASSTNRVTITGLQRLSIQVSPSGPRYWYLLYSLTNNDAAFSSPERTFGPFEITNFPTSGVSTNDFTAQLNSTLTSSNIIIEPNAVGNIS